MKEELPIMLLEISKFFHQQIVFLNILNKDHLKRSELPALIIILLRLKSYVRALQQQGESDQVARQDIKNTENAAFDFILRCLPCFPHTHANNNCCLHGCFDAVRIHENEDLQLLNSDVSVLMEEFRTIYSNTSVDMKLIKELNVWMDRFMKSKTGNDDCSPDRRFSLYIVHFAFLKAVHGGEKLENSLNFKSKYYSSEFSFSETPHLFTAFDRMSLSTQPLSS